MSAHYNVLGAMGSNSTPVVGRTEPIAHPQNCKTECPYGYNKALRFISKARMPRNFGTIRNMDLPGGENMRT